VPSTSIPSGAPSTGTRWGFALRYMAIAGCLFGVYAFPTELFGAQTDWLSGYLAAYARLAGAALHLVDPSVAVSGTLIQGRYPLQIVRNCDASEIMILLVSAIAAYPGLPLRRLAAAALGIATVVCVNVLRICTLYYVGVYRPSWFKPVHEEVWPLLLVASAGAMFMFSIRFLGARATPNAAT
jgi:exosortase/archaeosortase family protein